MTAKTLAQILYRTAKFFVGLLEKELGIKKQPKQPK